MSAYLPRIAHTSPATLNQFADTYLDKLQGLGAQSMRVTDKMPQNFLHVGLIAPLFPKARIIHCRRNPLDTCLSCYFPNFADSHPYAYDLRNPGFYYRGYERLMAHWRTVMGPRLMEVQYEELVGDLEGISRRMVDFCGLEWSDACLRFYETKRLVRTASYDQVRRPIYTKSVGRWRNYESHLGPLRAALEA